MFYKYWLIVLIIPFVSSGQEANLIDVIHRKLTAENADWARLVTYILRHKDQQQLEHQPHQQHQADGYVDDATRYETGEQQCCPTLHSGTWCRRPRRQHLRDHEGSDYYSNEGELYDATDWTENCNTFIMQNDELVSEQQPEFRSDQVSEFQSMNMPFIYSVLLNFGHNNYYQFLVNIHNYLEDDHGCDPGYVWDPFFLSCRMVYCSAEDGGVPVDGVSCPTNGSDPLTDWGSQYVVEMEVIQLTLFADAVYKNESLSQDLFKIVEESFVPAFAAFMGIQQDRITNVSVDCVANHTNPGSESLAVDFLLKQAEIGSGEPSIDAIVALLGSIIVQDQLTMVVDGIAIHLVGLHEQPVPSREESFDNWCRGGNPATYFNDEFTLDVINDTNSDQTVFRVYIKSTKEWHESGQFLANIFLQGAVDSTQTVEDIGSGEDYVVSGYVVVCEDRSVLLDTTCPVVHLNESEFYFDVNVTNIVHYTGNIPFIEPILTPGHYQSLPNGDLAVCLHITSYYFPEALLVSSYVQVILTSISIAGMSLTIITYLIFYELRNLPGMAVLSLCASTVLFDLAVMFGLKPAGTFNNYVCITIGIIIHYEALISFFWTNVLAIDLYLTLGRWSAVPRSVTKMLPRYAIYAYGVPMIIVLISITINFCNCTGDNFYVGYGELYCYISDPNANFFFFGVPLILILIANLILFILSVNVIRKVSSPVKKPEPKPSECEPTECCTDCNENNKCACCKIKKQLKKKNGKWGIYARMSTVLGFTWIFGLVTAFICSVSTPSIVFAYLYSVLNGLEGVMIFVAFTCNRRVYQLYKELLNSKKWFRNLKKKCGYPTENASKRASKTSTTSSSVPNEKKKPRPSQTLSVDTFVSEELDQIQRDIQEDETFHDPDQGSK